MARPPHMRGAGQRTTFAGDAIMGKRITLERFTSTKFLNDDPVARVSGGVLVPARENFKLELYADSCALALTRKFDLTQGQSIRFSGVLGSPLMATCLKSMELVLIEEDGGGGAGMDDDTDEIIRPIDLLWPVEVPGLVDATTEYLTPDRTARRVTLTMHHKVQKGSFELVYKVEDFWQYEDALVTSARAMHQPNVVPNSPVPPRRSLAEDKGRCRWICSLDGGGMRGIFALRVLEQMEQYYGTTCDRIFDMYACTSTGALIGACLAAGVPVSDLIALYGSKEIRALIWQKANAKEENALYNLPLYAGTVAGYTASSGMLREWLDWYDYDALGASAPEEKLRDALPGLAGTLLAPWYRKDGIVRILNSVFSTRSTDGSRRFMQLRDLQKDILITAFDTFKQQTVAFSAFHSVRPGGTAATGGSGSTPGAGAGLSSAAPASQPNLPPVLTLANSYGRHQALLVKDVVEASMSAPPFFAPRERFVDGGVGSFNNPAFLAAYAALHESHLHPANSLLQAKEPLYRPYDGTASPVQGTVIWSLGTGIVRPDTSRTPGEEMRPTFSDAGSTFTPTPTGSYEVDMNRPIFATYWVGQLIEAFMTSASEEQSNVVRKLMADQVKLVRCNIDVSEDTVRELGHAGDRAKVQFAPGDDDYDVMDDIAKRYARELRDRRFGFDEGGVVFGAWLDELGDDEYARQIAEGLARYS